MKVIVNELVVRFDTVVVAETASDRLSAAVPKPEVEQRLTVLDPILKTFIDMQFQKTRVFLKMKTIFLICKTI